ncbi:MAG: hypothetical protein GY920_11475 [Aliivibrio sp.]|jgi:hypothetical protein|nr:hypothetical protein [Aliivibrio sp.]
MTYIIKHDHAQGWSYPGLVCYVKLSDEKNFNETYNPWYATKFSSKKEAKDWIDMYSPLEDDSTVVAYKKEYDRFKEWCDKGMIKRSIECIDPSISRPYNDEKLEDVIDWWIRSNGSYIKEEHYKTWPKLLSIACHLVDVEFFREDGVSFQIKTSRDGDFKVFEKELELVIDRVTRIDERGFLIFSVFDHYLSEGGNSVCLLIHPKTKEVEISGRYEGVIEFTSLKKAFKYLKKNRYYE